MIILVNEYDFVCVQVDSGYSTTSAGTASIIDGLGSDCHGKESFGSNLAEEAFQATRHTKVKVMLTAYTKTQGCR